MSAIDRPDVAELARDLVDEQVAEPGDHGLIHQRRLEPSAPPPEGLGEPAQVESSASGP